jgi:hypothetical protein
MQQRPAGRPRAIDRGSVPRLVNARVSGSGWPDDGRPAPRSVGLARTIGAAREATITRDEKGSFIWCLHPPYLPLRCRLPAPVREDGAGAGRPGTFRRDVVTLRGSFALCVSRRDLAVRTRA